MRLKNLQAINFMTYENLNLDLDRSGTILILGENRDASKADSNGSGKSAIFDAICWALFGNTIRGEKGDAVVNKWVKKNCVVTLTFEEGGDTYKVIRHQKDKNHFKENDVELFKGDAALTLNSMSETQGLLEQIIGFDFATFRAFMPGAGVNAAQLTDKGIKELLENILQTESLSQAGALAKKKLETVSLEKSNLSSTLDKLTHHKESIQAALRELSELEKNFEDTKKAKIADLSNKKAELLAEIDGYKRHLASLKTLDIHSISEELECIRAALSESLEKEQDILDKFNKNARFLQSKRSEFATELRLLEKELKDFTELGPVCEACKQEIPHEHSHRLKSDLEARIAKLKKSLHAVDKVEKESLDKKNEAVEEVRKEQLSLAGKKKELEDKLAQIAKEDQERQRYVFMVSSREKDILEIAKEIETVSNSTFSASSSIEEKQEELSRICSEIQEAHSKLESINKVAESLTFWVNGFSTKGVRSYMLRHITPVLNEFVSKYASLLTDTEMTIRFETEKQLKNGTTKEDFNIIVEHKHGANSYAGSSAGERSRADLAIAMALGDLAGLRSAKTIPFRFLDEAFEKVDESGLDAIVTLLRAQEEEHGTIFVVTHNSDLKQYFDKTITVVKENGVSRILEA